MIDLANLAARAGPGTLVAQPRRMLGDLSWADGMEIVRRSVIFNGVFSGGDFSVTFNRYSFIRPRDGLISIHTEGPEFRSLASE